MVPAKERHLVNVAAEVLADEAQALGITYSGFCLTGFPHKRLADGEVWEKRGHNVTLLVEPGRLKTGPGPVVLFGVPYGGHDTKVASASGSSEQIGKVCPLSRPPISLSALASSS